MATCPVCGYGLSDPPPPVCGHCGTRFDPVLPGPPGGGPGGARRPWPAIALAAGIVALGAVVATVILLSGGGHGHPPVAQNTTSPTVQPSTGDSATSVPTTGPPSTPVSTPPSTPPSTQPSTPATRQSTPAGSPAQVVQAFYAAINEQDFSTAWGLGGNNLASDYNTFSAGYDTTSQDDLTVVGTSGGTVYVQLTAEHTDGSVKRYVGSYTVRDGRIVAASLREV